MAEQFKISNGTKEEKYALLLRQISELVQHETDSVALMANAAAMIHQTFRFLWTGFYRVVDQNLILGPFQGPLACTRIPFGKGVCGTAWAEAQTLVVPDVNLFPGHIACSSDSKSEIVVPLQRHGRVIAVLDIDSERPDAFDNLDALWLDRICRILANSL